MCGASSAQCHLLLDILQLLDALYVTALGGSRNTPCTEMHASPCSCCSGCSKAAQAMVAAPHLLLLLVYPDQQAQCCPHQSPGLG
jgi:hypothetical protein